MKRIFLLLSLLTVFTMIFLSSCEYATHIGDMIGGVSSGEQGGESTDHNNEDINDKNDAEIHTHDYSVRDTSEIYLKSSATCTDAAAYYFSCSCGERGEETFFCGEALGHILARAKCGESMYCYVCGVKSNKLTEHIWNIAEDGKSQTCTSCGAYINLDEHIHSWIDATCAHPKTCSVCSATEGGTLEHKWVDATCTSAKKCFVCETAEGDALGHNWQAATCVTAATCLRCGVINGSTTDHDWEDATCQNPKTCLFCGTTEGGLGNHNFVNNSCTICAYPEKTNYSVKVVTAGGMPLSGILVYVHNVDGYGLCTTPLETDENGMVEFTLMTSDNYSVELQGVPDGYAVKVGTTKEERYSINSAETVITLTSAPITTGGFKSMYNLGDVMYDFTLTDVYGNEYSLSTLLETKDMVMLNFWFAECGPCFREFPYINSVYSRYNDSVEILAINDYNDVNTIKAYPSRFADGLDVPLFAYNELNLSKFPSYGYPTTVIIDRYGVVCSIEIGAMVDEESWVKIFEHFTGDDYEQRLITSVDLL